MNEENEEAETNGAMLHLKLDNGDEVIGFGGHNPEKGFFVLESPLEVVSLTTSDGSIVTALKHYMSLGSSVNPSVAIYDSRVTSIGLATESTVQRYVELLKPVDETKGKTIH